LLFTLLDAIQRVDARRNSLARIYLFVCAVGIAPQRCAACRHLTGALDDALRRRCPSADAREAA
jgi:hypothetical protein